MLPPIQPLTDEQSRMAEQNVHIMRKVVLGFLRENRWCDRDEAESAAGEALVRAVALWKAGEAPIDKWLTYKIGRALLELVPTRRHHFFGSVRKFRRTGVPVRVLLMDYHHAPNG